MIGNIRRLCFRTAQIRHLSTSSVCSLRYLPKENTGIYRRLKVISEDEPDLGKAGINYDSMEELEQDFLQADDMHDEIEDHMRSISKAQQLKMIERRHFRSPKEPSMLTWSEKEQIKHLHQTNPDKWTPEKLAESFPASPTIIKKIVKLKWKPASAERLKAHDHKVSENWKAFHKGQLEVHDLRLRAHLSKFTDRKDGVSIISDEEAAKITEIVLQKPKRTEYLSIITSFRQETVPNKNNEIAQIEDHSHKTLQIKSKCQPQKLKDVGIKYTLDQYRRKLEGELDKMTDSQEEVKTIIKSTKQGIENVPAPATMYVAPSERFKTNAVVYRSSEKSPLTLKDTDNLPNRIQIPKEEWRPGLLYKVDDCFYNDEGYFLYRVPGLKS